MDFCDYPELKRLHGAMQWVFPADATDSMH